MPFFRLSLWSGFADDGGMVGDPATGQFPKGSAAAVFALTLLACVLTAGGHLYSPDGEVLFRVSQSIARRGELAIEPIAMDFATMEGRGGRHYAQYGVGQAVLAAPLVWAGGALAGVLGDGAQRLILTQDTWLHTRGDPREICERFAISFFNSFIAAALATLLFAFAFFLTRRRGIAFITAMAYALATLALPHARTFFSEPLATLCVFGALYGMHAGLERGRIAPLILGGAAAGFSLLVRVDSIITMPALILYGAIRLRPSRNSAPDWPRILSRCCAFLIPLAVGAAAVGALNWFRFGSPFSTGYEDQTEGLSFQTPLLIGLHGFLASPGKGLFFFSPPLILALWAFGSMWRRDRALTIGIAALILSKLLFHSKWGNWPGGECWGPRHIFLIHVFLALTIAPWLMESAASRARRMILAGLIAVGVAAQIYGCSQDFVQFYRVMFKTPAQPPSFYALYYPSSEPYFQPNYDITLTMPDGSRRAGMFRELPAPLQDSIYHPQHTCWFGYSIMANHGYNDFLWLRLMGLGRPPPA